MKLAQFVRIILLSVALSSTCVGISLKKDGYHVFPGDNIQDALQEAARNRTNKIVKGHAGEYRPNSKRQALIWFNRMHGGSRLEGAGEVTLRAANPELTGLLSRAFPGGVNPRIYF